jgi:predicted component of type VI protein secretion system
MTDESLRQLLDRVHERLSSTGSVDPESREMLATVMRDIDGALARGTGKPAGGTVSAVPVSPEARVSATAPRLEELAVRFEADHPTIAQSLRQIGALLGQAGI